MTEPTQQEESSANRLIKRMEKGGAGLPELPKAMTPAKYPTLADWINGGIKVPQYFNRASPRLESIYKVAFKEPDLDLVTMAKGQGLSAAEWELDNQFTK